MRRLVHKQKEFDYKTTDMSNSFIFQIIFIFGLFYFSNYFYFWFILFFKLFLFASGDVHPLAAISC